MRQTACCLALSLLLPALARAELKVELREGRLLGLLSFVEALSGGHRGSPRLKELFSGSRHDGERQRALLAEYRTLRETHLSPAYRFRGAPAARGEMGFGLLPFLSAQAALASDLADLSGRTSGLMPIAVHQRWLAILRELAPSYDELVHRPSRAKLAAYRKRLEAIARRAGLPRLLEQAARFYGASWSESEPFRIVLHPIPGRGAATSATVVEGTALVEALLEERDLEGRFGVLVHELCHSFFQAQPEALQRRLDEAFRSSSSPFAPHAYRFLDEALATALGNGWAYRAAKGRLDPGSWYADPIVDRFARLLLSLIETYLEKRWTIDAAFVAQAVTGFQRSVPDATREYAVVLRELLFVADGKGFAPTASQALRRYFQVRGITSMSPIAEEETARSLREAPRGAAIVLAFSTASQDQLRDLGRYLPSLKTLHGRLAREPGDLVLSTLDSGGRAWILFRLSRPARLEEALAALKRARLIRADRPILRLP